MNGNKFDEMQLKKRNEVGHQTLLLLVLLLMLDVLFYSLGFRWVGYPTNIEIIVMVCCGAYGIRLALAHSLISKKHTKAKSITVFSATTILSLAAIAAISYFLKPAVNAGSQPAVGSILLQVISWGIIVILAVIHLVSRHREKSSDD